VRTQKSPKGQSILKGGFIKAIYTYLYSWLLQPRGENNIVLKILIREKTTVKKKYHNGVVAKGLRK
jgi:hypothetical protein